MEHCYFRVPSLRWAKALYGGLVGAHMNYCQTKPPSLSDDALLAAARKLVTVFRLRGRGEGYLVVGPSTDLSYAVKEGFYQAYDTAVGRSGPLLKLDHYRVPDGAKPVKW